MTRQWIGKGVGLAFVLAVISDGTVAQAAAIVAPLGLQDVEGNNNNGLPFNVWYEGASRTQQVFGASNFSSIDGPQYIQQIAFRQDGGGGAFGTQIPDVTIALSTTSRPVDGLSPTFADNIGADAQTVYSGSLPLFSLPPSDNIGSAPRNFDVVINLQHPFLYDPSKGNLLLDITNSTGTGTTQLDAVEALGDSVSRVSAYIDPHPTGSYSFSDLTRGTPDSIGLVTRFLTGGPDPIPQPGLPGVVPEPSTIAVLGLGFLGALGLRRRARERA